MSKIDRLIIANIDNTITGDDAAMNEFFDLIEGAGENVGFGIATGRRYEDALKLMADYSIPKPEVLITSAGTEICYGRKFATDLSWKKHIDFKWSPEHIREVMDPLEGVSLQDASEQSAYKVSYKVDFSVAPKLSKIRKLLRQNKIQAKVILSLNMFLDIIPVRAGNDISIRHISFKWGLPLENILVAGNSGNEEGMLAGKTLGIVVGNYSSELEKLRKFPRIYFAQAHHAAGIIEGIHYYDFLDTITIPNEKTVTQDA